MVATGDLCCLSDNSGSIPFSPATQPMPDNTTPSPLMAAVQCGYNLLCLLKDHLCTTFELLEQLSLADKSPLSSIL